MREPGRLQLPPANLELALSSVVRELGRLQIQVEILQQQIDDLQSIGQDGAPTESRLSRRRRNRLTRFIEQSEVHLLVHSKSEAAHL